MRDGLMVLYRGDEFVDVGTVAELADRHGVDARTIRFLATPTHHRRTRYGALRAYRVDGDGMRR